MSDSVENASVYDPEKYPTLSSPPWIVANKEVDSQENGGMTANAAVMNADPLGVAVGGFPPRPDIVAPVRLITEAMSKAKSLDEMKRCNAEITSLTRNMVTNALMTRATWMFESLLDPRGRDLYRECGYPFSISPLLYREMYDRDGIAARVNDVLPEECWEKPVVVYEDEDEEANTAFELDWKDLEEQHNIYHFMERIDKLSGVGSYGLLLIGIDDGKPLNQPIDGYDEEKGTLPDFRDIKKGSKKNELLFLRAFDESMCHVAQWNNNPQSKRFAQPEMYLIRLMDPTLIPVGQSISDSVTHMVHWTRVVHIADNRKSSEIFGIPRMKQVFNRLLDLRKLYGGSAEMFWKGGFPGIGLEVSPEYADSEIDYGETKQQMDDFQNSLKRYFAVAGMTIKSLAPNVADPKAHIEGQLQAISITIGVPWRVFVGSEQAVKAGEQDSDAWDVRLDRRKTQYLSPMLVRPIVERIIVMGLVTPPEESFHTDWPDSSAPTLKDKAAIASAFANALVAYMNGGCDQVMAPLDFFITFCGMAKTEAEEIVKNAAAYVQDQIEQQQQQEQGSLPTAEELSQGTGLDVQDAGIIMSFISQYLQQASQGGEQGTSVTSDTNGNGTPPSAPQNGKQKPNVQDEEVSGAAAK